MGISVHNSDDNIIDMRRSVQVTFNEECKVYRYRNKFEGHGRCGRMSYKASLWYTNEDFVRFEDDFEEDRACRQWIERQRIRNLREIAWRSFRKSSLRLVSDTKKRLSSLTPTEKKLGRQVEIRKLSR